MKSKSGTRGRVGALLLVAGALGTNGLAQTEVILFADDFDQDTRTNWVVRSASDASVEDFTVDLHYDYGTNTYLFQGQTNTIPPAPGSTGATTRGVRVTVNKLDAVDAATAVNLYPTNQSFAGNFALRLDLWINYAGTNAYGEGAAATAEFALFGINQTGTNVNWPTSDPAPTDGLWFAVDGEGGSSRDYRAYEGNGEGFDPELRGDAGGFLDRDGDGIAEVNAFNNPDDPNNAELVKLFPSPPFETPGVPGKRWVEVEVSQVDDLITWKINGNIVAQRPSSGLFTAGNLMLGYMDILGGIADPPDQNYALFDNVRVVRLEGTQVGPPENLSIQSLANGNLQLTFTGSGEASQYHLQTKTDVAGTWEDDPTAVVQTDGPNQYRIEVPNDASSARFFRIRA